MKIKKKISLFLFLILAFSYALIPFVLANSYTTEFEEDERMIWEITTVDHTKLQSLCAAQTNYDYANYEDFDKGDQIEWEITDITSYTDYDKISFSRYFGEDLIDTDGDYDGSYYTNVAKNPTLLGQDINDGSADDYSLVLMAVDIDDFLEEVNDAITNHARVYTKGSTITIDNTQIGDSDIIKIEIDENGIQEDYRLYYLGDLVWQIELEQYITDDFDPSIIIYIVIGVIVVVVIIAAVASRATHVKKRPGTVPASSPAYAQPVSTTLPAVTPRYRTTSEAPEPVKETKIIGICELCGEKRDEDAVFCSNCGAKF